MFFIIIVSLGVLPPIVVIYYLWTAGDVCLGNRCGSTNACESDVFLVLLLLSFQPKFSVAHCFQSCCHLVLQGLGFCLYLGRRGIKLLKYFVGDSGTVFRRIGTPGRASLSDNLQIFVVERSSTILCDESLGCLEILVAHRDGKEHVDGIVVLACGC